MSSDDGKTDTWPYPTKRARRIVEQLAPQEAAVAKSKRLSEPNKKSEGGGPSIRRFSWQEEEK